MDASARGEYHSNNNNHGIQVEEDLPVNRCVCGRNPSSTDPYCGCGRPNADFDGAHEVRQIYQSDIGGPAFLGDNWGIQAGGDVVIGNDPDERYKHRIDMKRKVLGKALLPDNWLASAVAVATVLGFFGVHKFADWNLGKLALASGLVGVIGLLWCAGYLWVRNALAKSDVFVAPGLDVVFERTPSGEIVHSKLEAPCWWCGAARKGGVMRLKTVNLGPDLKGPWEARWVCNRNPDQHSLGFDHTQVPDFD